jgi:sucrose phosphorylase
MWKEVGTSSIHRPQTHHLIQLLRTVLDAVAPQVMLITETNVPHADNLSYFGDGHNEAQMVYNFALPPLTLHAILSGNAKILSDWAAGLKRPSDEVTFFNFLASHDGIGVNPARGILPEREIEALAGRVQAHGGRVSYKHNSDGSQSPYELNINYFDALSDPAGGEPLALQVDRFMCAQAIMLALAGVPGIYFHSLFGSRGWPAGITQTGRNRTINREKLVRDRLEAELESPDHLRQRVFRRYARLLRARSATAAFHPLGSQRVLEAGDQVFAMLRVSPDGMRRVICLHNVSAQPVRVNLDPQELEWGAGRARRMINEGVVPDDNNGRLGVNLSPFGTEWLVPVSGNEELSPDA